MLRFAARTLACGALALGASSALAGGYGAAGCGLGSLIFGSQSGPVQILAATTNGTFASQTFGITTGTSNCGPGLFGLNTKDQEQYVASNRAALSSEISQGGGEAVNGFAAILGCESVDYDAFSSTLQQAYPQLSAAKNSSEFLKVTKEKVKSHQVLSARCGFQL